MSVEMNTTTTVTAVVETVSDGFLSFVEGFETVNQNDPTRRAPAFDYRGTMDRIINDEITLPNGEKHTVTAEETLNATKKLRAYYKEQHNRMIPINEQANANLLRDRAFRAQNSAPVARIRFETNVLLEGMVEELEKVVEDAEKRFKANKTPLINVERMKQYIRHGVLTHPYFEPYTKADLLDLVRGMFRNNSRGQARRRGMENYILPGYAIIRMTPNDIFLKTGDHEYPITGETLVKDIIIKMVRRAEKLPYGQDCVFETTSKKPSINGFSFVIPAGQIHIKGTNEVFNHGVMRVSMPNDWFRVATEGCTIALFPKEPKYRIFQPVHDLVTQIYGKEGFIPQNEIDFACIWTHMTAWIGKLDNKLVRKQRTDAEAYLLYKDGAKRGELNPYSFLYRRGYRSLDDMFKPEIFTPGYLKMLVEDKAKQEAADARRQQRRDERIAERRTVRQSSRAPQANAAQQQAQEVAAAAPAPATEHYDIPDVEDYYSTGYMSGADQLY